MRISFQVAATIVAFAALARADRIDVLVNRVTTPTPQQVYSQFAELLLGMPFDANCGDWSSVNSGSLAASNDLFGFAPASEISVGIDPTVGDANLDGAVNRADLVIVARNFQSRGATWETGDFDADGTVAFSDLLLLAQHYNAMSDAAVAAPLPSPAWGGMALLLLAACRRLSSASPLGRRPVWQFT